ncbi:ATP-binding protein [Pelagovum pacificum]|nr:ATP-binding protein [Pelagovum pacificum]QQA41945.1 PAS-domain containing protein [Pelagovum pacificum]
MATATVIVCLVGLKLSSLSHQEELQQQRLATTQEMIGVREQIEESIFDKVVILAQFIAAVRENPDFTQDDVDDLGALLRQGDESIVNIALAPDLRVDMFYPVEGNEAVRGFDYTTSAQQYPGVLETIDSGETRLFGPISLVQGNVGSILRQAVFLDGADGERQLWGIISIVLDHTAAFEASGLDASFENYDIVVIGQPDQDGLRLRLFGNSAASSLQDPVQIDFDYAGSAWSMLATPKGGWASNSPVEPNNLVILMTCLLALAATWYILHLGRTRQLAQAKLSRAIEALDGGFAMYDAEDRLVVYNSSFYRMYDKCRDVIRPGVRFEDILRHGLSVGQYPEAVGREEEWFERRMKAHLSENSDFEQQLSNGRWYHVSESRSEDGMLVGIRVDVTAVKQAQEAAESANKAKTDFMNVLSHELRTPLTVILGYSGLGMKFAESSKARQLVTALKRNEIVWRQSGDQVEGLFDDVAARMMRIDQSGRHLLFLINEMLDFSKLSSGTLAMDLEACDGARMVSTVTDQMESVAAQKGIDLQVQLADCTLLADTHRSQQILFNLVGNAVKFSESGVVSVVMTTTDSHVDIAVTDDGPGIASNELDRIFEPFHQVDSTATRKAGGTGLGLSIAKELASLQDGSVSVVSKLGQGSTFLLRLPLFTAEDDSATASMELEAVRSA